MLFLVCHSISKLGTKQYYLVIRLYKIKEPPSPAPIVILTFDFLLLFINTFLKRRTIGILQLSGESREFLTFRTPGQKKVKKGLLKY